MATKRRLFERIPLLKALLRRSLVTPTDYRDRRVYARVRTSQLVKCTSIDNQSVYWVSNLKDLSEGGIRFWLPRKFSPKSDVRLFLHLGASHSEVPIGAKVVWTYMSDAQGKCCEVGASFTAINQEQRLAIRNLVSQALPAHTA